jgi:PAS domain S-box-containing protein
MSARHTPKHGSHAKGPAKQEEQELRYLKLAIEACQLGLWDWNLLTNEVWFTPALKRQIGFEDHEITSDDRAEWRSRLHPDDRERFRNELRALAHEPWGSIEYRIRHKDDSYHWILTQVAIARDDAGKPVRMLGSSVDITNRKQAEQALIERETQLALCIEHCPAPIAMLDQELRYLAASRRWCSDFKLEGSLFGRRHYEVFPDLPERWKGVLQRCLKGQVEHCDEDTFVRADGSVYSVRWEVRPWRNVHGEVGGIVIFSENITEHLLARRRLSESEERLRLAVSGAGVGTWHWDLQRDAAIWSDRCCSMFGVPPGTLMSIDRFLATLHPDDRARIAEAVQRAIENRSEYDAELRTVWPDGSVHWVASRGHAYYDPEGRPVRMEGAAVDIDDLKRAQEEAHESQARLKAALRVGRIGTLLWEIPTDRLLWDESLLQLVGRTPAEDAPCHIEGVVSIVHPEDRAVVRRAFDQAVERGSDLDLECRILRADGAVLWVAAKGRVEFDTQGRPLRMINALVDITSHKALEAELLRAQKLEAIARLAGGVAHDFNNLLQVILGQASLLNRRGLPSETEGPLRSIVNAAERAAGLTTQLLAFARRSFIQPCDLDLNEALTKSVEMLRHVLGEDIALVFEPASEPVWVHADANMLMQALLSFGVNARDAMPHGGRLEVRTSLVSLDAVRAASIPEASAGNWACIRVRDTGCGIPPEILPRIFEPFLTTKDVGQGTGLGLASIYGIVKQHQGFLTVESAPARGTTFEVYLPAITSPSHREEPKYTAPEVGDQARREALALSPRER